MQSWPQFLHLVSVRTPEFLIKSWNSSGETKIPNFLSNDQLFLLIFKSSQVIKIKVRENFQLMSYIQGSVPEIFEDQVWNWDKIFKNLAEWNRGILNLIVMAKALVRYYFSNRWKYFTKYLFERSYLLGLVCLFRDWKCDLYKFACYVELW